MLNISLVGPAGRARTRSLRRMPQPAAQSHPSRPVVVYIDFRTLVSASQAQCFRSMTERLFQGLRQAAWLTCSLPPKTPHAPAAFSCLVDLLRRSEENSVHVVYLLNNFDECERNPALSTAFFSALRSLASLPTVAFVCASTKELHQIARIDGGLASPFYNVFVPSSLATGGTGYVGPAPILRTPR